MNKNQNKKVITASLALSEITEDISRLKKTVDENDKKAIVKRVLGLSSNFNGSVNFELRLF